MTEDKKAAEKVDERDQSREGDAPQQEGKPAFQAGDRVLVNRGLVAKVLVWDEPNNLVVYQYSVGRGTDTVTAPISHTDVRPASEVDSVFKDEEFSHRPVPAAPTTGPVVEGDEVTTYDSFTGSK